MEKFKEYLQEHKLSETTVTVYCSYVKMFMGWLKQEHYLDASSIRYTDLLAYIQYEKKKNVSPASINLRLGNITWYFEFLKKQGEIQKNIARTLRVKGEIRRVIENPLDTVEIAGTVPAVLPDKERG